jgi:hypothetical protein
MNFFNITSLKFDERGETNKAARGLRSGMASEPSDRRLYYKKKEGSTKKGNDGH